MSEKMMSFEEWYPGEDELRSLSIAGIAERAWNAARLGTIPAEGAIAVPEYPEYRIKRL